MKKFYIPKAIIKHPIFWVVLVAGFALLYFTKNLEVQKTTKIQETAIDITSVKEIAEWEFLTIQREEFLTKTNRRAKLSCIYNGTIRLGLNMKHAKKNWAKCSNDTALLELPAIEILDRNFIDDSSTRTFHSEGNVSATMRESLYHEAKNQMKANALTAENIAVAEQTAKLQFTQIFKSLGFKHIEITMEECIE